MKEPLLRDDKNFVVYYYDEDITEELEMYWNEYPGSYIVLPASRNAEKFAIQQEKVAQYNAQ